MKAAITRLTTALGIFLTLAVTPLWAAESVNIQVSMPTLTCGKGDLAPEECILNGTMRLRGAETLNGPVRYYCDIRYTYVAAGNESQAIRFNGRIIYHGEATLTKGRAQQELAAPLTLKLSNQARQIEVAEIGCERE
jgi:hypothetical protein